MRRKKDRCKGMKERGIGCEEGRRSLEEEERRNKRRNIRIKVRVRKEGKQVVRKKEGE